MGNIIIDALANTNVYVEKKTLITITANKTKNNEGLLKIDDLDNQLISKIDSGNTLISRVKEYSCEDSLMLYNQTTKQIQLVKSGDSVNIPIDFITGTKYFLCSKRIIVSEHNNNIFNIDLKDYSIFKIYLDNGMELLNYTYDNSKKELLIKGLEAKLIEELSEIIIFVYKKDINSSLIENYFVLEYYNYASVYDYNNFINGNYFDDIDFIGYELICFEKLIVNENVEKETTRPNFSPCDKKIIKNIEVSCELETFNATDLVDFVQYVGNDEFRLVLINPSFGRFFFVNNCAIDNGVNITFQKEGNMKNCKISCGNYIDVKIDSSVEYGKGLYGKGLYGGGTWITNSYRREV